MSNLARKFQQQQQVERTVQEQSNSKNKKALAYPWGENNWISIYRIGLFWCRPNYLEPSRNLRGQ